MLHFKDMFCNQGVAGVLTKSARYVSSFEDWIELLLLKLKS